MTRPDHNYRPAGDARYGAMFRFLLPRDTCGNDPRQAEERQFKLAAGRLGLDQRRMFELAKQANMSNMQANNIAARIGEGLSLAKEFERSLQKPAAEAVRVPADDDDDNDGDIFAGIGR